MKWADCSAAVAVQVDVGAKGPRWHVLANESGVVGQVAVTILIQIGLDDTRHLLWPVHGPDQDDATVHKAMQLGSACGALCCTQLSGRTGLPTLRQAQRLLARP